MGDQSDQSDRAVGQSVRQLVGAGVGQPVCSTGSPTAGPGPGPTADIEKVSDCSQRRETREERRETQRRQRVERLLSGELRKNVRPASEMSFNYEAATAIARRSQPTPRRSQ